MTSSCSLFSKNSDDQLQNSDDDASDYDDNYGDEEEDNETSSSGHSYRMPQKPTAWFTLMLVTSTPQPPSEEIANCIEEIKITGDEAGNSNAMLAATSPITSSVEQSPEVYHWCFFQIMVNIDNQMHKPGLLMQDVANNFFNGMKQLWILSQVLDSHHKTSRYFEYLQSRYVQISKDIFGRDVVVMARPMSNINLEPDFQKSAGKAPVNGESGPEKIAVEKNKVRIFETPGGTESLEDLVQEVDTNNPDTNESEALQQATPSH